MMDSGGFSVYKSKSINFSLLKVVIALQKLKVVLILQ